MRSVVRDLLIAACGAPGSRNPGTLAADEWAEAIAAADAAGLAGPLYAFAERLPAAARPGGAALDSLRTLYYAQAAQNADLLATLGEILQALAERGIPAVVLKGAAFLEALYGNLAARSMKDLDLLFRRADLDAAVGVVERLGFAVDEWFRPSQWYVEHLHHLVPYRRGGITVELHHHVVPPWVQLGVSAEELWQRSVPAIIAGAPARVLAADDCLLTVAVHVAAAHGFLGGLDGLRDLAQIQRSSSEIDWQRLKGSARGQERAVWAALDVTRRLLGGEPPPAARDALAAGQLTPLERRALGLLARNLVLRRTGAEGFVVPTWFLRGWAGQILAARGWLARARGVLKAAAAIRRGDDAAPMEDQP